MNVIASELITSWKEGQPGARRAQEPKQRGEIHSRELKCNFKELLDKEWKSLYI